jgi:pilus assembly protein FimV
VNDIDNRLDDFFGEKEDMPQSAPDKKPLEKLKSIILSIDWEITDSCLRDLIEETKDLMPQFAADRLTQTLLRMLNSLGRYIHKRKASAHPDAIKRILSVYSSLEKLSDPQITDTKAKEQILVQEINAFKKLKHQVEGTPPQAAAPLSKQAHETQNDSSEQSSFEKVVSDVEERFTSEVQKLKDQLSSLKKEFDILRKS